MSKFSVVTCSRNDGFGIEHSSILSLNNFITRYDEIVYVDWNSPNGVSLLDNLKSKLSLRGNIKHVKVTKEDLQSIDESLLQVPFHEVLAKNVGVRRASNDFILSSNIDIIAHRPPEDLDDNTFYTTARWNVPPELHLTQDDALKFGNELPLYSGFQRAPNSVDENGNAIWDPGDNYSLVVCCGDFQLAHKNAWYKVRGFEEEMIYRSYQDSNLMRKAQICCGVKKIEVPIFHLNHPNRGSSVDRVNNAKKYGTDFQTTNNKDNWGLPEYNFKTEVL